MAGTLDTPVALSQMSPKVIGAAPWRWRAAAQGLFIVPVVFALWTLGPSVWVVISSEAGARLVTKVAVVAGLFAWTRDVVGGLIGAHASTRSCAERVPSRRWAGLPVVLVTAAALVLGVAPGIRASVAGLVALGAAALLLRRGAAQTPQARRGFSRQDAALAASLAMLSALTFTGLGGIVAQMLGLPDDRGVVAVALLVHVLGIDLGIGRWMAKPQAVGATRE